MPPAQSKIGEQFWTLICFPAVRYRQIDYEVADRIATVTLDRPEHRNAWTSLMQAEFIDALDQADADDHVRAVIVTGRGRDFCVGADLSSGSFTRRGKEEEQGRELARQRAQESGGAPARVDIAMRLFHAIKPVIAAVNGAAAGVGTTMTLPMDIRLASESARFGLVFTRRGMVPEACATWFLPRLVGPAKALEWILGGKVFGAEEALAAGLVHSVHPDEELLSAARAMALDLTESTSAAAVAMARRLVWRMMVAADPVQAYYAERSCLTLLAAHPDIAEGVSSFLERRPPKFTMRPSQDLPDLDSVIPPGLEFPAPGGSL
jgi:enoyl-CoA hydratase/carnithine racemase